MIKTRTICADRAETLPISVMEATEADTTAGAQGPPPTDPARDFGNNAFLKIL